MTIYRPIRSNLFSQGFGENKACIGPDGTIVGKTPYNNTGVCPIGYEDLYKKMGMLGHSGEDWTLYRGEPIYHSGDFEGYAKTEVDQQGGIGVDVINTTIGYKLRYWHLKSVNVFDGQQIKTGDLIGWGNSTGLSSADHLHWSLKQVGANGQTLNPTNGYTGAIDFRPWFENKFVLDVLAPVAKPKYNFKVNLNFGQQNADIKALQDILRYEELFPLGQASTSYYGSITAKAVLAWQIKHNVAPLTELNGLQGRSFGPKSRAVINALYI